RFSRHSNPRWCSRSLPSIPKKVTRAQDTDQCGLGVAISLARSRDLVCTSHLAARLAVHRSILYSAPLRALRLQQISSRAAGLLLSVSGDAACAAVDSFPV